MKTKAKQTKVDDQAIQFGIVMMLSQLLPRFKTPTYGDMKLVDAVFEKLEAVQSDQQAFTMDLFKTLNVPETEVIDQTHPQYMEVTGKIMSGESKVTRTQLALFSLDQFNRLTDGVDLTYGERKQLHFWLVKSV